MRLILVEHSWTFHMFFKFVSDVYNDFVKPLRKLWCVNISLLSSTFIKLLLRIINVLAPISTREVLQVLPCISSNFESSKDFIDSDAILLQINIIYNVNNKLASSSASPLWLNQMSSWEINVLIQRDRASKEEGYVFEFIRSSGKCSVILKNLLQEPYWIFWGLKKVLCMQACSMEIRQAVSTKVSQSYRAWKPHFGCLETVFKAFHEYVLGIFKKLFRQTTDLIVYVPLFSADLTRFTVSPAVTGSSLCFSQKRFRAFAKANETEESPLSIFSGTVRLFFDFFAFQRVPPSSFFWYFATNWTFNNLKGSLLQF